MQNATKPFETVTKDHPAGGISLQIYARLTLLSTEKATYNLSSSEFASHAKKVLREMYVQYYGFNVGDKPLTAAGRPVEYKERGWKTMPAAFVDFKDSSYGNPEAGWLGEIHQALSKSEL